MKAGEINTISFDKKKLEKLREAYNKAVKNKKRIFVFEGRGVLTGYAKYMLEYLEKEVK